MKNILLVFIVLTIVILVTSTLQSSKNTVTNEEDDVVTIVPPEYVETTPAIDAKSWELAELHQDISVLIPQEWSAGSDGVYNYDHLQVTGPRDPNFPDNSFKCVFYKDSNLSSKLDVKNEQVISSNPSVTLVDAIWNDSSDDSLRKLGDDISIYTYKGTSDEVYVECNVFKGEIQTIDREILENIILTIQ